MVENPKRLTPASLDTKLQIVNAKRALVKGIHSHYRFKSV